MKGAALREHAFILSCIRQQQHAVVRVDLCSSCVCTCLCIPAQGRRLSTAHDLSCWQGQPVWMEHAAAIDVTSMEAEGITLEDYVFYHVRVSDSTGPASFGYVLPGSSLPLPIIASGACPWSLVWCDDGACVGSRWSTW